MKSCVMVGETVKWKMGMDGDDDVHESFLLISSWRYGVDTCTLDAVLYVAGCSYLSPDADKELFSSF